MDEQKTIDGMVSRFVRWFEESEDASRDARDKSERDRDYYDGVQWTAEEIAAMKKRRQPIITSNNIRRKINFLRGFEKKERTAPKALPRNPVDQQAADVASSVLRFVYDESNYKYARSEAWSNYLVEGIGIVELRLKQSRPGDYDVEASHLPWDRFFFDPHSARDDFADARYLGAVFWRDLDEVVAEYGPEAEAIAEWTLSDAQLSETYDDKPKTKLWADRARKRIRICVVWYVDRGSWSFAEFTKGGILRGGPSYITDEDGNGVCGIFARSCYADRDNNRSGIVRDMISPQDEINKRRSKALHLLSTAQIITEKGAVDNIEETRREAARPDGVMMPHPGMRFEVNTRSDLAAGQITLLQEAQRDIEILGPNAAMLGDAAGNAASGKAIVASQQGGVIESGDMFDDFKSLDHDVFKAMWLLIRQWWTAERWVRITDDEGAIQFMPVNTYDGFHPAAVGIDIIIDDEPASMTMAEEQYSLLKELVASGALPPNVLIEAIPNLRNRQKIVEALNQPDPAKMAAQQMEFQNAQAEIAGKEAKAGKTVAETQKIMTDIMRPPPVIGGGFMQ